MPADFQDYSPNWFITPWWGGSLAIPVPGGGTIQLGGGSAGTENRPVTQPVAVIPTMATGSSLTLNLGLIVGGLLVVIALIILFK